MKKEKISATAAKELIKGKLSLHILRQARGNSFRTQNHPYRAKRIVRPHEAYPLQ